MTNQRLSLPVRLRHDEKPSRTRRQQDIPAVVYGAGLSSLPVTVSRADFERAFRQTGYSTLIKLAITGEQQADHTVLIRDIQLHPTRGTILHVDFYQPRLDQQITARVPLRFTGESEAVKNLGGTLVHPLEEVELEALPTDLPHDIKVDISKLKDFAAVIHVRDLAVPPGVELQHEPDEVVALVQPPRTEEELQAELTAAVAEEDVEKVEGVKEETAASAPEVKQTETAKPEP